MRNQEKHGVRLANVARTGIPYLGLVLVVVVFGIWSKGNLFSPRQFTPIFNSCFTTLLTAMSLMFVMSQGLMDLSVGGIVTFSGILGAYAANVNLYLMLPVCLLAGLAIGFINGLITAKLHVGGFMVTLAVGFILEGLAVLILYSSGIGIPLKAMAWSTMPLRVSVLIVLFVIAYVVFEFTAFGRRLKATGANPVAAAYAGVDPAKQIWMGYMITGTMAGLIAFFMLIRTGAATNTMGGMLSFDAMIALLIGGFPVSGGTNAKARSALIGSLTITILVYGMTLCRIDTTILQFVKGILFLAVVCLTFDRKSTPVIK